MEESATYRLSETQVKAILDLRLHRLTALGRDDIGNELKVLATEIEELLSILADRVKLYGVLREELVAVRAEFATPRRTLMATAADGIDDGAPIGRGEMGVPVRPAGHIKPTHLESATGAGWGKKMT